MVDTQYETCELDIILTYFLKDLLPTLLETITQIVNILLTTDTFPLWLEDSYC